MVLPEAERLQLQLWNECDSMYLTQFTLQFEDLFDGNLYLSLLYILQLKGYYNIYYYTIILFLKAI